MRDWYGGRSLDSKVGGLGAHGCPRLGGWAAPLETPAVGALTVLKHDSFDLHG